MDSVKSFLSASPENEEPEEEVYDNIFEYLISFIGLLFSFTYNNFAYIFGTSLVIFGILVYIYMTKIDLSSQPMGRSKTIVIEAMSDMSKISHMNDMNDNGDNTSYLANNLLSQPISDLKKKLKSGFCKMHALKKTPITDIDNECGSVFEKSSCLNADCCGWAVTSDNPDGKCRAGDKSGVTFKYDDAGKKIDIDCYYYKGNAGIGSKCVE